MKKVIVDTERKKYFINIGEYLMNETGSLAAEVTGATKAALITDDNVDSFWSGRIIESLESADFEVFKYVIPNGEGSKNSETYLKLLAFLSENKLSRSDTVFALGGGMVGDIAGFAASTYLRGINFVQIPTTLLAMVDSSVGGKTAINLDSGKNQAGTFYQPDSVVCDPHFLSTLPTDIYLDGCAEVIKYAVIGDSGLFELLKEQEKLKMEEVIERCLKIKSDLVHVDEFDTGPRQLLNFGHTFGHAIEKCSNYAVPHGKAVAIGMVMAASAAEEMGICSANCQMEIKKMVMSFGLPYETKISKKELLNAMISDKKRSLEELTFVFPKKIGQCVLKKVPIKELKAVMNSAMKEEIK